MTFLLSWQQKFRALIALTLVSMCTMAAVSLWAGHSVNKALKGREDVAAYASASTELMNHWWQQNALRQEITSARLEDFNGGLAGLHELIRQLLARAEALKDDDTLQQARELQAILQEELGQQRQWLSLNQQLGLKPFEGQRQALTEKARALEAISFD